MESRSQSLSKIVKAKGKPLSLERLAILSEIAKTDIAKVLKRLKRVNQKESTKD